MSPVSLTNTQVTEIAGPAGPRSGMWRMLSAPQKPSRLPRGLDAVFAGAVSRVQHALPRTGRLLRRAARIKALQTQLATESEARLRAQAEGFRELFRRSRETPKDVEAALALTSEIAYRTTGLNPHPVQVAAALALHAGCLAELATGEGKTLSAALAATLAGWRGRGCHVITVNDYLVQRDAEWMGPLYRMAGLSVAYLQQQTQPAERRAAYGADVTYVTNKEVAADFLRDRLVLGRTRGLVPALVEQMVEPAGARDPFARLVQRGLDTAIIDEADSILIDEAVTPLIISGDAPNAEQVTAFRQAAEVAAKLQRGQDYRVLERFRDVELTRAGERKVAEVTGDWGGLWAGARRREELVTQALSARELFLRDKQYIVRDDKVVIVDEFTGRLMPDRTWRDGLHQAVEAKEAITVNPPKATLARVSFQRFFRLYRKLSGMTGTAWEVRHETWQVYRMPVVRIPTHKPCIRRRLPDRVFAVAEQRWAAVVKHIEELHGVGRPVLVGTRSVRASEHLSELLTKAGLPHVVLNAVRSEDEAAIVRAAGTSGQITVATNMAGRGTDIALGRGVAELGGLHVLATERHESGRIDRQLFGRAGRQGDPGSAIAFPSLDDELVRIYLPKAVAGFLRWTLGAAPLLFRPIGWAALHWAQRRAQRRAQRSRRDVLRTDDWLEEMLGFAGPGNA